MLDKHFVELYARNIENEINVSIKKSMDGVCKTIRNFAYDVIAREAPELDEEHRQKLLDEWIPSMRYSSSSCVKNGLVNGIPSAMMFEMVLQFTIYAVGKMPQDEIRELVKNLGTSWSERYWNVFPIQIKKLIRTFIKNEISFKVFNEKIKSLLGISF